MLDGSVHNGIELHKVTLRHEGRIVLDNVSFEILMGGFTVIVGPSGSGKSTIADLMVRLVDPDPGCGSVLLDGMDLRALNIKSLRTAVVLIDQTPHLLHGTLFENIAYAKPHVSRLQVEEAAEAAGLGDLLGRLPQGLD